MKVLKIFLIALGAVIVAALIIGGVSLYLLTRTTGLQDQLRPTQVTTQAAQSFDQKLDAFDKELKSASAAGSKKEVTLVVTEQEVNSKIAASMDEIMGELPANVGISDVKVNFEDGKMLWAAKVDVSGIPVNVGVESKVITGPDGKPQLQVESVDVGKFPLPAGVRDRIEALVAQSTDINDLLKDVNLDLRSIAAEDGQLTLKGLPK